MDAPKGSRKNVRRKPDRKKIMEAVRMIIDAIGDDLQREGLRRTPRRIADVFEMFTKGYRMNVALKRVYTEQSNMVVSPEIFFCSLCEHHFMPFFGYASIAYIPKRHVTGLSKLDWLVRKYALRLQIQERMTEQIADELWETLQPYGVMVVTRAVHTCKMAEGLQPTVYVCSACKGVFLWHYAPREEALKIMQQHWRPIVE